MILEIKFQTLINYFKKITQICFFPVRKIPYLSVTRYRTLPRGRYHCCSLVRMSRVLLAPNPAMCSAMFRKSVFNLLLESPCSAVDFDLDGRTLAVGTTRGKVVVYDMRNTTASIKNFQVSSSLDKYVYQGCRSRGFCLEPEPFLFVRLQLRLLLLLLLYCKISYF